MGKAWSMKISKSALNATIEKYEKIFSSRACELIIQAYSERLPDLVDAAIIGQNACSILADECKDEGEWKYKKIWGTKRDKIIAMIEEMEQ